MPADLEELQKGALTKLKALLSADRYYYIREDNSQSGKKNPSDKDHSRDNPEQKSHLQVLESDLGKARNSSDLTRIANRYIQDPEQTKILLLYLEMADNKDLYSLRMTLIQSMDSLITSKQGTLILQTILRCCEDARAVALEYCKANLNSLATQEHGSRILHTFIEQCDAFRHMCFDYFKANP